MIDELISLWNEYLTERMAKPGYMDWDKDFDKFMLWLIIKKTNQKR